MADLSVRIGNLLLKNPVMTASGTFGYGVEYADFIDLSRLGGIIVKGTTMAPREGNPYPRMAETPMGMLNAVGIQNKGARYFAEKIYPTIKDIDTNMIVNVSGSDIDSYVVLNQNECYTEVINIDSTGQDYSSMYKSPAVYAKNNMKLTDAEAIVELAKKSVITGKDNMESPLALSVYYRLKSGRNVSRTVWVDVNDESNDSYLNRIVGPAYYKEGIWQAMSMNVPKQFEVTGVAYVNSLEDKKLNITDAERIIYLWREDMSAYDYNRVRYDNEQGYITITMSNWTTWSLPVYSCFTRINNYLEKEYDYVDQKLPLEAIEKIKITKYDTDYGIYDGKAVAADEVYDEDSGSYIYEDPEQIAQIYEALYVRPMHSDWKPYNSKEDSYSVEIDLTQEYINTYNSVSLYSYNIKGDEIDKLVEEGLLP